MLKEKYGFKKISQENIPKPKEIKIMFLFLHSNFHTVEFILCGAWFSEF